MVHKVHKNTKYQQQNNNLNRALSGNADPYLAQKPKQKQLPKHWLISVSVKFVRSFIHHDKFPDDDARPPNQSNSFLRAFPLTHTGPNQDETDWPSLQLQLIQGGCRSPGDWGSFFFPHPPGGPAAFQTAGRERAAIPCLGRPFTACRHFCCTGGTG